ncbi:hypothetical protein SARC_05163 [Sphaeroforma arctica JP610]|uniref:Uncharacterized protein n=1 Tax=Sphaeroforma arctica JP610 TaxID=667725 RepID=A0A0L0G0F3_9EUKA|nr:hypothetical protein SARC_05163 [Sphaeroforma arctica JP610]KNC82550.1 hypothetical protein SARC_05163 [Sphaeroforma arctica JP610]|eukprot:XP_014156452.1 hypothetical protein SARC_05163 [Sphaeroforma arctica JP610]
MNILSLCRITRTPVSCAKQSISLRSIAAYHNGTTGKQNVRKDNNLSTGFGPGTLDTPQRRANYDFLSEYFNARPLKRVLAKNAGLLDIDIRQRLRHLRYLLGDNYLGACADCPELLLSDVNRMTRNIERMPVLLCGVDTSALIQKNPRLLVSDLESVIVPAFKALGRLFGDSVDVKHLISRHPTLLTAITPDEGSILISLRSLLTDTELEKLTADKQQPPVKLLMVSNLMYDHITSKAPTQLHYSLV